jgi:hypothetical protein
MVINSSYKRRMLSSKLILMPQNMPLYYGCLAGVVVSPMHWTILRKVYYGIQGKTFKFQIYLILKTI